MGAEAEVLAGLGESLGDVVGGDQAGEKRAGDLGKHVEDSVSHRDATGDQETKGNGGVEMRVGVLATGVGDGGKRSSVNQGKGKGAIGLGRRATPCVNGAKKEYANKFTKERADVIAETEALDSVRGVVLVPICP